MVYRVLAADGQIKNDGGATGSLLESLLDEDKFIKSDNEPKAGDVFLWRYGKGTSAEGHTGIVESVDADGTVHTIEAYGKDYGTIRNVYSPGDDGKIKVLTGHKGWQGFFRPKNENPDKDQPAAVNKNETPAERQARIMNAAEARIKATNEYLKKQEQQKAKDKFDEIHRQQREERGSILEDDN